VTCINSRKQTALDVISRMPASRSNVGLRQLLQSMLCCFCYLIKAGILTELDWHFVVCHVHYVEILKWLSIVSFPVLTTELLHIYNTCIHSIIDIRQSLLHYVKQDVA